MHKNKNAQTTEQKEFEEKVIQISRVSKKTKGGNKMGFSVLMVVGDKKGKVGVGLGKAQDVLSAIKKGIKRAKRKMITVPLDGTTVPFPIVVKKGAGRVMLKPAPKGSGVIAGGPVRAVVEAAGVRDISSKILGSSNQASSVYATFEALKQIQIIVKLKGIKLKSIAQVEAEEAEKLKEIQAKAVAQATAHTTKAAEQKKAPVKAKNVEKPKKAAQQAPTEKSEKPATKVAAAPTKKIASAKKEDK